MEGRYARMMSCGTTGSPSGSTSSVVYMMNAWNAASRSHCEYVCRYPRPQRQLHLPSFVLAGRRRLTRANTLPISRTVVSRTISLSPPSHILAMLAQFASAEGNFPSTACSLWMMGGRSPLDSDCGYAFKRLWMKTAVPRRSSFGCWPGRGTQPPSQRSRTLSASTVQIS
jgi:hypothetical protein